jgi:hypothetical protein
LNAETIWPEVVRSKYLLESEANSLVSGIPTGIIDSGGSIIFSEVTYAYTNTTGKWLIGTITIADHFYVHPRKVSQIGRTANSC